MTADASGADGGRTLRVVSLYADVMNVYADRGNLMALRVRAAEHGVALEEVAVSLGDALPADADLVLIGGGQDREQRRIAGELAGRGPQLRAWAEADVAMLAVCGGFQLFGRFYRDGSGEELPGAGVFDVTTVAPGPGWPRCIGDVLATSLIPDVGEVVGFENHAGRTYLGAGAEPFAIVEYGHGNNGDDGTEGARYREAIGTYLHGSVLPKNLALLDHLILAALRHREGPDALPLPPSRATGPGALASLASRAQASAAQVARRRSPRVQVAPGSAYAAP